MCEFIFPSENCTESERIEDETGVNASKAKVLYVDIQEGPNLTFHSFLSWVAMF